MFVSAVENVSKYTRQIQSIMRNYGSQRVTAGSSTLFFVNDNGDAITCRHVAELIVNSEHINKQYALFGQSRFRLKSDSTYDQNLKELEQQFNYKPDAIIQMKNNFYNCFDKISSFDCHLHPQFDLAIIRFKGFQKKYYEGFATFINSNTEIKQGKSLCRLGFPFPEFTNFSYNYQADDIQWTREGNPNSPTFPIDGIITRLIIQHNRLGGIEMSTPGLRGQSGGPLFDTNGIIYGMQSSTRHLHLGFDLENFEIPSGNQSKKITNTPFLHVGQCIHPDIIKEFLRQYQVPFSEATTT